MKKFFRLLVLIHCLVYLPLKEFQLIFVVNYVPVLFLAEQRFEIIDLFLESFLVKVNVLVHFSLSLPKHVRDKLLYPSHHYLRFYPEIILFSLNGLLLLLVKSNQIFIFLFDGAKKVSAYSAIGRIFSLSIAVFFINMELLAWMP